MKKFVILLMTVAMMLSTLSCGVTPVLMAESVTELTAAEETSAEDAPDAQPLAGTVEVSETLRPGTSPAPVISTKSSSGPAPASASPASNTGNAAASAAAKQTTQNKTQPAAQNKASAGNTASASNNDTTQTAVVSTLQSAELPDLLTAQNFPDPVLLSQLRAQYPEGLTAETIGSVRSFATSATISDMTGIELLTGLEDLELSGAGVFSGIDLGTMPCLRRLVVCSNKLQSLDVSRNPQLRELYLFNYGGEIRGVDLSACPDLRMLLIHAPLTSLDLRCNTALAKLVLHSTKLEALDLSHNPAMLELDVQGHFKALDLSCCPLLQSLTLVGDLSSLDLSACSMLSFVRVDPQSGASVAAIEENGRYYLDFASIVGADKLNRVLDLNGAPLFADGASGLLCLGDVCPDSYTYRFDMGCPLGMFQATLAVTAPAPTQQEIPDGQEVPVEPEMPVWKSAYGEFLRLQGKSDWVYFLYDLNDDATPELIVKTGNCEANYLGTLYTCTADGQVAKIGTQGLGHSVLCGLSAEHSLLQPRGQMGYYALFKWIWDGTTFSVETILPATDYGHDPYPYETETGSSLLSHLSMTACGDPSGLDWNGNPQDENHLILAQGPVGQQAGACEHHYVITQVMETETTKGCLQHTCSACGDTYFSHYSTEHHLPSYMDEGEVVDIDAVVAAGRKWLEDNGEELSELATNPFPGMSFPGNVTLEYATALMLLDCMDAVCYARNQCAENPGLKPVFWCGYRNQGADFGIYCYYALIPVD